MALNSKPSSGLVRIVFTLIVILACAAITLVSVNLIGVSFFAAADSPTFVSGSAPLVRTSGTPTAELPPSPEPPTGPAPAKFPTFDIRQLKTPDPNAPSFGTEEPLDPTQPPRGHFELMTPDPTWTNYTHPTFGFSFQYPSNWILEVSDDPPSGRIIDTLVEINNSTFIGTWQKGDKLPPAEQRIKISVYVIEDSNKHCTNSVITI